MTGTVPVWMEFLALALNPLSYPKNSELAFVKSIVIVSS